MNIKSYIYTPPLDQTYIFNNQYVGYESTTIETDYLNINLSGWMNVTKFYADGYQLAGFTVTFSDMDLTRASIKQDVELMGLRADFIFEKNFVVFSDSDSLSNREIGDTAEIVLTGTGLKRLSDDYD